MIKILGSKWMAVGLGIIAYAITTWTCLNPAREIRRAVAARHTVDPEKSFMPIGPSWNFHNPELNQALAEIKEEREALRVRARELDDLEARLKTERQEIYSVTQTVHQLRIDLESIVTRITEEEAVNLKKLAKVYAAMSPEGAAKILREMQDDQVAKILVLMKESEFAPILESLAQGNKDEAKRAALLSNRLRLTLPPAKKASG
jgi:flagellar motility protein MotE (MotC chaperone)